MNAVDIVRVQLNGSLSLVADHAAALADVWTRRAFPGASLPGFTLWHCARIVDWGVNGVVRGAGEVGEEQAWRERIRFDLGHGAGLTAVEADGVAATVTPGEVAAYAGAISEALVPWLAGLSDGDLDHVPDLRGYCTGHPRYSTEEAWAEVASLEGIPAGQFLTRPCVAHIRVHMGEVEALAQAARAAASSS